MDTWEREAAGVISFPSGRRIRGRALRRPLPAGPLPDFAVYLLGNRPAPTAWEQRWVRWPDFWLPANTNDAMDALREAWDRAESERVEIACLGGHGRTGTALACIAVMDGVPPEKAVSFVRDHYGPAVETPWQDWYVRHVAGRIK
ncbi:dual specificity protein phosphatase [Arthrobacter sp. FB24]|jgi:protein-tyrosine phosphatase|uniref:protein-tyrosine phosphatase family protein n=1 Tax=Arthrobacter sp. (strain FB24) TaxID=290399 RepID=UPI000052784E|nr:protein-tyrosine phosphatase family protein [Arthrobacter sp. FB24]ABK03691.1 dual specificity protein phosphatase [Arthrobacter sp. FB24]